jgi:type IV pilus assembly protein PilM
MNFRESDLDFLDEAIRRKTGRSTRDDPSFAPSAFNQEDVPEVFPDLDMLVPRLARTVEAEEAQGPPCQEASEALVSQSAKLPAADDFLTDETLEAARGFHEHPEQRHFSPSSKLPETKTNGLPQGGDDQPVNVEESPFAATEFSFERKSPPPTARGIEEDESFPAMPASTVSTARMNGFGRALRNLFSFLQGNLIVGLDLGSRYFKYVALSKTRTGYQLEDYDCAEVRRLPAELSEPEREKQLAAQVENFLSGKPLRNCRITSAVSGLEVLFRHHVLPRMPKKDLAGAVPWATRKDLPFPVETALIDYAVLGTRKEGNAEKLEVAAIATPASVVERHLAPLRSQHATPQKVSTVAVALWNLLMQKDSSRQGETKNLLVIDIGAISTHMIFIEDGRLLYAREITTAGDEFTEALTSTVYAEGRDIVLSPNDAEALKQQQGLPLPENQGTTEGGIPFAQITIMLRPVVDRLANEIQRSLDYYREKFKAGPISMIYLTGGGAQLRNLASALASQLGIAAEVFNPLQLVQTNKFQKDEKLPIVAPQLAVAIGLALDRRKELNLLPAALKGAFQMRAALRYFRYVAALGVIAITCVTGFEYFRSKQFSDDLLRLQLEYNRLLPRQQHFVELLHRRDELQNHLAAYQSHIRIRLTVPQHLQALSNLVPPSLVLTSIDIETMPVQVDDKTASDELMDFLIITGMVLKSATAGGERGVREGVALADFLIALEKSGYFRSLDLRNQQQQQDGAIKFTLACFF